MSTSRPHDAAGVDIDPQATARAVITAAVVIELTLFVLNYVFNFYDITGDLSVRRIFNLAREQSLPTFFASLQAVAVGMTALALRATVADHGRERWGWTFVAVFWIYVGIDDNAEIHERIGSALGRATEDSALVEWWPTFSWQLFLAPVLAAGLLGAVLVAWFAAPRGRVLLVACLVCFAVAQGIDMLEGLDGKFDEWAESLDVEPYTVGHGLRSIEEMLEMFGTTAYWSVVLTLLATRVEGRRFTFRTAGQE